MSWFFVIASGVLNIGWLVSLRQTAGFHRLIPLGGMALFGLSSTYCLSRAMLLMPASVAFVVYTALTVAGSLAFDVIVLRQSFGSARIGFIVLIVIGILGLQSLAPAAPR
ncbi:MAG TPA: SMR family transporter [Gemmatimonadaceae bacterium]|nr:SMR family transporter [Gemmatimonadaceae bacterium]